MNVIDLIVVLVLIVAVWNGWRQGFVVQVCSLAGLVAGIWLAAQYGAKVGGWLGLDAQIASAGGFVAVLVIVVIAVAIGARLLRKGFHAVGFGIPDIVLGVAVSLLKYLLLLSVLFSALSKLNADYSLVKAPMLDKSITYKPVMHISEALFPFLEWVGDQVPQRDEQHKHE